MRSLAIWTACLALGSSATAQDSSSAKGRSAPEQSTPEQSEIERRLEALNTEYMQIMEAWQAAQSARAEAAAKGGEELPPAPDQPPIGPLITKAMDLAREFEGNDHVVSALTLALFLGVTYGPPSAGKAADLMAEKYAASPKMADLGPMFPNLAQFVGEEKSKALLAAIKAQNEDPTVRGWLLMHEHGPVIASADTKSEKYLAARAELLGALEKTSDQGLAQTIRGAIDEREKFGRGVVAPNIVGVDLDGVAFKLSDYKGKVIFLDFWGDW